MNIPNETRIATEVSTHRRISAIGSPQRHYRLNPPLTDNAGNPRRDVVVIEGVKSNYAFVGDTGGEVTDFAELAVAGAGSGDDAVLSMLGYRVFEKV